MKRCAIAALAIAAMALPTAAVTFAMVADFPAVPRSDSVLPIVHAKILGYKCGESILFHGPTTTVVTSGPLSPVGCLVNPTGFQLVDGNARGENTVKSLKSVENSITDAEKNNTMAEISFDNVLLRDRSSGFDTVVASAVIFGTDDGRNTCCRAAAVTVGPQADPAITLGCPPCNKSIAVNTRRPWSSDLVFNAAPHGAPTVHVDFHTTMNKNATPCSTGTVAGHRTRTADGCVGPVRRFVFTAASVPGARCVVEFPGPIQSARAVTIATGVTRSGQNICANVAVVAQDGSNVPQALLGCPPCSREGF